MSAESSAAAGGPSLVSARQRRGKNNCPQLAALDEADMVARDEASAATRRYPVKPCRVLSGSRIRLLNLASGDSLPLRCKGWKCRTCGPWLKGRFIASVRSSAKDMPVTRHRFLTLTLPAEAREWVDDDGEHDLRRCYAALSHVWANFRKRVGRAPITYRKCKPGQLCRACGAGPGSAGGIGYKWRQEGPFQRVRCASAPPKGGVGGCGAKVIPVTRTMAAIWVREGHKDGLPHLHVLVDRYMDQDWVSKTWESCGGGPVADIRQCSLRAVTAYVSKYLAKSLDDESKGSQGVLKGFRRYGRVGDVAPLRVYPEKKSDDPYAIQVNLSSLLAARSLGVEAGWSTVDPADYGHAILAAQEATILDRLLPGHDARSGQAKRRDRARRSRHTHLGQHDAEPAFDVDRWREFWAEKDARDRGWEA